MSKTQHPITDELLDQLLANYQNPEDLIGADGILKQLTKKLVERALDAELTHHLGHDKHQPVSNPTGNTRNGFSKKKLKEMYGAEVSPSLISSVTDAVADEVKAWQSRPLDAVYPIVYLDCIHTKVREGAVRVKAVYLALGINLAGEKEILGLWIAQNEGAKFWLQVVTELRNRGVQDIFVACVDGLKGFPEAIEAVFPHTSVQLCIVHMVRHSLNYVSWKRRAEVAADLKRIYQSSTADEAELRLGEFEAKWDDDYLPIGQSWRRNWPRITPFFDFPPEIRKVIYTTNAIESVNMSLRKITKNRGSFPSDEALLKLFYLALRNISKKWTMPIRDWKAALTRFTISYEDRLPQQ
ncbi:IS256 family transposase [Pseudomonas aeruginosa]|nr:IS256 family transposase [Pseudomonas aeruginosa]